MLPLGRAVELLDALAPLACAEEWDNVGLLIEPLADRRGAAGPPRVERVLFTVDLTDAVLAEVEETGADLVVAYHPPLFRALKRLGTRTLAERAAQRAVRAGVAVYSPHTALDAAPGGVNDWLADGVGAGKRAPLVGVAIPDRSAELERVTSPRPLAGSGLGRGVTLSEPVPLEVLVERLKAHLGRSRLRVARPEGARGSVAIERVALCAGSGGGVFERAPGFDAYVTGELSHHAVLAHLTAGSSVVLCEHSSSERGFLPAYARRLSELAAGALDCRVAAADREPIETW